MALPLLGSVVFYGLLGDEADQRFGIDERSRIKLAVLYTLLNDLPDRGLGQGPGVHLLWVLLGDLPPLD